MRKANILALAFLITLAGNAAAYIEAGSDLEFGSDLEYSMVDVVLHRPRDDSSRKNPVVFQWNITCADQAIIGSKNGNYCSNIHLYNATDKIDVCNINQCDNNQGNVCPLGEIPTELIYVDCNQTLTGEYYLLPNTDYNWTASASNPDNAYVVNYPTYFGNNTLTVTNQTVIQEETGGACLTQYGMYFNYTAGDDDDYTVFDLTKLNDYVPNGNLSNVWVEYGNAELYDTTLSNKLIVDTGGAQEVRVWLSGFNFDYNHSLDAVTAPDKTVVLEAANFSVYNPSYLIEAVEEYGGEPYNMTFVDEYLLKAFCIDHAPDTFNMKTEGLNKTFITAFEQPLFSAETKKGNDIQVRKIKADSNFESVDLVSSTTHDDMVKYYFVLSDYIGRHRSNGRLRVSTNVNETILPVHYEPWYFDTINDVYLVNGSSYLIESVIPGEEGINYGWITPYEDGYKDLVVADFKTGNITDHFEGFTKYFYSDHESGTVGMVYNLTSASGINYARFIVRNSSYDVVYNHTVGARHYRFAYVVADNNQSYHLMGRFDIPDHSESIFEELLSWTPSIDFIKDIRMPDLYDVESDKLQVFIAYFMLVCLFLLASYAYIGKMSLVAVGWMGLMYQMEWVGEEHLIYIMVSLCLTGIIILAKDRRRQA